MTSEDAATAQTPEPLVSQGTVCVGCMYELGGLPPGGVCPECGTAVQRSLLGDRLSMADAAWLSSVERGLSVGARIATASAFGTVLAWVGMMLGGIYVATRQAPSLQWLDVVGEVVGWLVIVAWLAGCLGLLIGWWRATALEPGKVDPRAERVRIRARWSAFAMFVYLLLLLVGSAAAGALELTTGSVGGWTLFLLYAGVSAFHYWSAMTFIELLANRIPEPKLVRKARTERVTLAIATSLGVIACGLGPLIALVSYLVILERTGGVLRRLIAAATLQRASGPPLQSAGPVDSE